MRLAFALPYLQKLKEAFDREGMEIPDPHRKIVQSPMSRLHPLHSKGKTCSSY